MLKKNKKLLIIGHVWPQPNATAAGEHIMHLIHFFKDLEYQLLFVSAAQQPDNYTVFSEYAIQTASIAINDDDFDTLLLEYAPDVVLFDRFMVEEQFSWRIKNKCPDAIRVLDTEDLHFLRKQRQTQRQTQSQKERQKQSQEESQEESQKQLITKIDHLLTDNAKRELASMYRCDLNLIISEKEIDLLKNEYHFPEHLLHYVPLLSNPVNEDTFYTYAERQDLVFVGNFLHEPNWHAVRKLKEEIWPLLSKRLPNTKLHIYGAFAAEKNYQLQNVKERFLVHGYVEDLEKVLKESKLLVAPLDYGAGQKGKLLKAMQYGTPTITTPIGAEGMHFNTIWPGAIAETITDFIESTVLLYSDKKEWVKAQQRIPELVNTYYNYTNHFDSFKERIEGLVNELKMHRACNITGQILWHQSLRSTEFMSRWIIEKNKIK